jgi:cell division protein FtsB
MKAFVLLLLLLFLWLQYQLWIDKDGVRKLHDLKQRVEAQKETNQEIYQRNKVLAAEVEDLKSGQDAIEERARKDLGMIREGEVFFQIIDKPSPANSATNSETQ